MSLTSSNVFLFLSGAASSFGLMFVQHKFSLFFPGHKKEQTTFRGGGGGMEGGRRKLYVAQGDTNTLHVKKVILRRLLDPHNRKYKKT